ncbi:hypothetical protein [Allorhizocola rhizosphaerae]|uniref:hypothetical protein n=1 Tax=Allorhizocola rhizosphaerae TaxID=1872709 RepID=UPI0013C379C2|nr:hypothetical protein [Allorhizocola rhizosphaerae]
MADHALIGARRMRRRRTVLATAATVAATGVITVPFLLSPAGQDHLSITPGASPQASQSPCTTSSTPAPTRGISRQDWPTFVKIAIGSLPARDDYVVSTATATCSSAYAVIDVGAAGELGHLTLNLAMRQPSDPANCAQLPSMIGQGYQVLFCEELTAATPMVFAISDGTMFIVNAFFGNGRHVWMESWGLAEGAPPLIGADELRSVVTNRALAEQIRP